MVGHVGDRLANIHRVQVHRDPWPAFERFERDHYDEPLRRAAAVQWAGRARAEYGSVHQFSGLAHALACVRAPVHWHGALARLVTDEVRHAELCAEMAHACWPEGRAREPAVFGFPPPKLPWPAAPPSDDEDAVWSWAAEAIAVACCIGETLSRPMLEAIAVVTTDPIAEACARQILRDEHLHATFGWEALHAIVPRLGERARADLQRTVTRALAGFEASTACGIDVAEVAGRAIEIVRGAPNLGTLDDLQYAMIFYGTLESEVLPGFVEVGVDGPRAWAERHVAAPTSQPSESLVSRG